MVRLIKAIFSAIAQLLRDINEILEDYGEEKVKQSIYKKRNFNDEEVSFK